MSKIYFPQVFFSKIAIIQMMSRLKQVIMDAEAKGVGIGHFNVSDLQGIKAVVAAAQELQVPVIIGVSEGERKFLGAAEVAAIVKIERERTGLPIYLNADHAKSLDGVKEIIDAGFDSVTADASALSLEENIEYIKQCRQYANEKAADILIEGELGNIGVSSQIWENMPEGLETEEENLTNPEVAAQFVRESGVDLLAPAVGSVHGLIKGGQPKLNINRVGAIRNSVGIPLVLHGASGNTVEEVQSAIKAGCVIVHINTELRVAYRRGLEKALMEHPNEVAPYKYFAEAVEEMKQLVIEKLRMINFL